MQYYLNIVLQRLVFWRVLEVLCAFIDKFLGLAFGPFPDISISCHFIVKFFAPTHVKTTAAFSYLKT